MTRTFHLGDILSIYTGRLVSPTHMDGIYSILNFMTGDNLFTHQIPRVGRECAPHLLRQFPWLAEVSTDGCTGETWQHWLQVQVDRYGENHSVAAIPRDDHAVIDPVEELRQMRPDAPVIAVSPPEEEEPA